MNIVQKGVGAIPKIIDNPRQAILEEAKNILCKEGMDGFNLRKVAKACNFAIGTIYNYFPTKKDIINQVMLDHWEGYYSIVEEIGGREDGLFAKLKGIYSEMEKFSDSFRELLVSINNSDLPEYTEEGLKRKYNFIDRLVMKLSGVLKGEFQKSNIKTGLDEYDVSRFIILNFIMMASTKQFGYASFEKILERLFGSMDT